MSDLLDALTPAEVDVLARHLDELELLNTPARFAERASYGLWKPYRHLVYTSNRIVAMIEEDACDCLIVEEPVRHGKSELCSRWTPAWYVLRHKGRVGLASYEADFASTHSRRAREIVSEWGPEFGMLIDERSRAAHRWDVVNSRAGMWAAGAGGPITGKGATLLVLDDPIKNAEEANSDVTREHVWEWWQSVFLTRRDPGCKVIVIMSRWHCDDLVARILAHEGGMRIERIRFPAIAEEDDILGRRPGDALCRELYDEEALAGIRKDVGPGPWSALYQQRPSPLGGGMFRRADFRYWRSTTTEETTIYDLGDRYVEDADCWRFSTMDPAYTARRRSDFTACATWAVAPTDPPVMLLLDMRRVRVESVDHGPLITDVWETWDPAWVGIEKQNATLSLFTDAQREGVVVRWLNPDKNKIARAETAAAMIAAGRVYFPRNAPWLPDFEDELLGFPVAAHDDQVDCTAYACIELARGTVRARRHRKEPETIADRHWKMIHDREKRAHLHPVIGRF